MGMPAVSSSYSSTRIDGGSNAYFLFRENHKILQSSNAHLPAIWATYSSSVPMKDDKHSAFHTNTSSRPKYEPRPGFQNRNINKNQIETSMELSSSLLGWAAETLKIKCCKEQFYIVGNYDAGQRHILEQYNDSVDKNGVSIHDHTMEMKNAFSGTEGSSECTSNRVPYFEKNSRQNIVVDNIVTEKNAVQNSASIQDHSRERKNAFGTTERSSECAGCKKSHQDIDTLNQSQRKLLLIYDEVLVVDNISTAKNVVHMLTTKYKDLIHACDTKVSKIDVKQDTPVNHSEIICFSIYSGPMADFGNGKSCIWVDLLDSDSDIIMVFAPFFEDHSIKKVWHNYSFDYHVIENYGIKVSGFHADTMHLARLWDSSWKNNGGYSLEALTSDPMVMGRINSKKSNGLTETGNSIDLTVEKISMTSIFGKKKLKKDGSEGKIINVAPVEVLQREERIPWICYSALDSISTLNLFESLKGKLMKMDWVFKNVNIGNMYDFYEKYWRPFGIILVEMEREGMFVDRAHLSEIEKVAIAEQKAAADKFRIWASEYCADAKFMNVGSDTQIRQLFFGGIINKKNSDILLPVQNTFQVPNVDNVIEEGRTSPSKFRKITLNKIGEKMQTDMYTTSGWPSISGDALKNFAGNISASENYFHDDECQIDIPDGFHQEEGKSGKPTVKSESMEDTSLYGAAYAAFGGGKKGRDACRAIASLREICSIDSLISNFIIPLQGNNISGNCGRIHCSLNINTETGRLSARRPNLQNPPALEKDRYKIREAFIASPGHSLIVADYGQLELRILAHLTNCKSMLEAFKAGGDFHSRTAMNMYEYIRSDVEEGKVLLEWKPQPGEDKPPVPLLKDAFASERRKAKMLNFSIAYGKTVNGLSKDWKVSTAEAKETVNRWYKERGEVLKWQEAHKRKAMEEHCVHTLLGRARNFPVMTSASCAQRNHIQRASINAPVQGSAADVAMCAMIQITANERLKELKWKLILQIHDEVILEGPSESAEEAKAIVVECMSYPFDGHNILQVDLVVDAKCAHSWYAAK